MGSEVQVILRFARKMTEIAGTDHGRDWWSGYAIGVSSKARGAGEEWRPATPAFALGYESGRAMVDPIMAWKRARKRLAVLTRKKN